MTSPTEIEPQSISALLADRVSANLRCERVVRAAVGNGQETWFIDARDDTGTPRQFVLRRSAAVGVLDDTDRAHEFATLQALEGRGLPTPRVYWLETEPSALQRPFFVMDRLPGRPPAPRSVDEAAAIARDIGRSVALVHAAGIAGDADDVGAITLREVARWHDRYLSRRSAPMPIVGALLAWLEANVPAPDVAPVLLWGDAGPHNILVEDGRISALLDWELSHVGHPLEDLGAAIWACLGRFPEDEVIAGYEEVTGQSVDRATLSYFAALGCVSRTIMQLAGIDAFLRGQTHALNLAGLGLTLPIASLRRAAAYADWPAVDDPPPIGVLDDDDLRLRPDLGETLDGIAGFLTGDVLPQIESAHLRRGLKTAVGLLRATARRGREEPARRHDLRSRLAALFDRLATAGVVAPGGPGDAHALEAAAIRVESEPAFATMRADMRRTLLADLRVRAAALEDLAAFYGDDVRPGPRFRR